MEVLPRFDADKCLYFMFVSLLNFLCCNLILHFQLKTNVTLKLQFLYHEVSNKENIVEK